MLRYIYQIEQAGDTDDIFVEVTDNGITIRQGVMEIQVNGLDALDALLKAVVLSAEEIEAVNAKRVLK